MRAREDKIGICLTFVSVVALGRCALRKVRGCIRLSGCLAETTTATTANGLDRCMYYNLRALSQQSSARSGRGLHDRERVQARTLSARSGGLHDPRPVPPRSGRAPIARWRERAILWRLAYIATGRMTTSGRLLTNCGPNIQLQRVCQRVLVLDESHK